MSTPRRGRGDQGQVAGMEAVPFGLLVFTVGTLLIAHTWAVVDAKFLTATAAREAAHAAAEAPSAPAASEAAATAAEAVAARSGRSRDDLTLSLLGGPFGRCRPVIAEAADVVPAIGLPWRGDRPTTLVRTRHREVVDPYRDGLDGVAHCEDG